MGFFKAKMPNEYFTILYSASLGSESKHTVCTKVNNFSKISIYITICIHIVQPYNTVSLITWRQ